MESKLIQYYKKWFLRQYPGAFFYKIPDGWAETKDGHRYGSNRPFDVVAIVNGKTYVKEFKFQHGGITFNVNAHLKKHQLESLLLAQKAGAKASVVLGWIPSMKVMMKHHICPDKMVMVEWNLEEIIGKDKLSIIDKTLKGK